MKLAELVNSFLQNLYAYFTPPIDPSADTPKASFYELIILPAMRSTEFRTKLLKDPGSVLSESGIVLPEGLTIKFLENTETTIHIVIPPYIGE